MAAIIKTIKQGLNTIAYSTISKAVYHFGNKHNNKRLDDIIDTMQTDIDSRALNADLTELDKFAEKNGTLTNNVSSGSVKFIRKGNVLIASIDVVMSTSANNSWVDIATIGKDFLANYTILGNYVTVTDMTNGYSAISQFYNINTLPTLRIEARAISVGDSIRGTYIALLNNN